MGLIDLLVWRLAYFDSEIGNGYSYPLNIYDIGFKATFAFND